ncbi:hypothetical protein GCM10009540_64660 [Streptomyces turgidiscabies]
MVTQSEGTTNREVPRIVTHFGTIATTVSLITQRTKFSEVLVEVVVEVLVVVLVEVLVEVSVEA